MHISTSPQSKTADHIMGLPTLLRNVLGFPHPEALSSRGTPVTTSTMYLTKPTTLTNLRHTAKSQSVRPSRPSHLPPHHPLADAHQNRRALRSPRAPDAYGLTHAMRRRSIVR